MPGRWSLLAAVITAGSGFYAATHFAITTDINKLISPDLGWRQRETGLREGIPRLVRLDPGGGRCADAGARDRGERQAGAAAERSGPTCFMSVRQLDGDPFFAKNGLLFQPEADLARMAQGLGRAGPIIGALAGDPSLRGLTRALSFGLLGVQNGQAKLEDLQRALTMSSDTIDQVMAGQPASFSWRVLLTGQKPAAERASPLHRSPAGAGLLRAAARPGGERRDPPRRRPTSSSEPTYQARVRLTGPVAMADEEFGTLQEGAVVNVVGTIIIVLVILWLALHSPRIILAVFLNLVVGFAVTAALGLDDGRRAEPDLGRLRGAVCRPRRRFRHPVRGPLPLRAIQARRSLFGAGQHGREGRRAADARGGGDRGGLPVVLPDRLQGRLRARPDRRHRHADRLPHQHHGAAGAAHHPASAGRRGADRLSRAGAGRPVPGAPPHSGDRRHLLVAVAGLPLLYYLHFDFNPINLRSPTVESVATFLDLRTDPTLGANAINVVLPNSNDVDKVADQLRKIPEVDKVTTLADFVPDGQERKLALIRGLARQLQTPLSTEDAARPPTDAQNVAALKSTADALDEAAAKASGPGADAANRLAASLTKLADAGKDKRDAADAAFTVPLRTALDGLAELSAGRPGDAAKPAATSLTSQWIAADGRARVQATPKGDPNDNETLRHFARAIQAQFPDAVGTPISILESGKTIVRAFIQAGIFALLSIAILLWIVLRRFGDVLLTLVPLLLAGLVTLEVCVLIGMPLNFANIIALPLLLGVGVAFKIYYIMAWRAGQTSLLQSSLTRAVIWSALTTATAFGSLWLSSHPGTSSMGKLLALSLVSTMCAAVLFQPALMGKPRTAEENAPGAARESCINPEFVRPRTQVAAVASRTFLLRSRPGWPGWLGRDGSVRDRFEDDAALRRAVRRRGAAPGAAILLRHLPRRRGRRRSDQSRRAGRRRHQARRDHGHIGGPEDSGPQRSVRLHDLFQRRAVPDVFVSDPRDPDRPGGLRHQFADDGRILEMECAGRQRNLQRHAGGVRRQAGGGGRPALPRGCRGVAKVESGVLARHSLPRLPRRPGAGRRRCDAAGPAFATRGRCGGS